jgi:transposase-like protein
MCVRVKCPYCGSENISGSRLYDNAYLCHECHVIFRLGVDQSDRSVVKEKSPLEKLNDRVVSLEDRFNELVERIDRLEEELKRRIL